MNPKMIRSALFVGLITFVLSFLITHMIGSSHPLLASLFIGFLLFELTFFHQFHKTKKVSKL
ncbi:hypothetical protein WAK64_21250 [Bacillus spongiae]|uniref:Uncharacterized protein n=1 Tax=Bacillus spongiae TaxID=2683610 RepID=A0ABU8HJK1_9BACI